LDHPLDTDRDFVGVLLTRGALQWPVAAYQRTGCFNTRDARLRAHTCAIDEGPRAMSAQSLLPAVDGYFEESSRWNLDRIAATRRSERCAWRVAVAGWTCAVSCAAALLCLMPLRRVDPFVIRVDNSTGVVDVVPAYVAGNGMDETVSRYFLTHYVTTCERFNYVTAESDYEECGAFHTAARNQVWYALWQPSNPKSPLNLHREGSLVRAQVQAVSFLRRSNGVSDLAQVRYLKAELPAAGAPPRVMPWIATIQYAYTSPSSDARVRSWNPVGFKVVEFNAEPEVSAAGEKNP